uniref:Uncharacterized protein n=1 Tax=Rhizophora mucronata TaxID=61149 RepID=A0A2P2K475_RHIMU
MSKTKAMEHLFDAVNIDPTRILQQTVCYDHQNSLTYSVAWGYSIQVFEGNEFLPDLLYLQRTFVPWRRSTAIDFSHYMFNTREYPRHPCKRPAVFFVGSVISSENGILSNYTRHNIEDCPRANAIKNLKYIEVFSHKLELDTEQMMIPPRRQCCDVSSVFKESMVISIRQCGSSELISMHL